jgi:hypothetical protein
MRHSLSLLILAIAAISGSAHASPESVTDYLRKFHANPARMMERLPSRVENGLAFSRGFIKHRDTARLLPFRLETRDLIMDHASPLLMSLQQDSDANGKDRPERVTDSPSPTRNLRELETQRLTRISLDPMPWTDSYWPTYKGAIAIRYADRNFPNTGDWASNHSYVVANPAAAILAYGDPAAINALSPAEKYDLAMGDYEFSLARNAWDRGARVYEKSGEVPKWVGFCHGWAAAAHMGVPIPAKPVRVTAVNGTPVTFYPQDVKALQSFLWANASPTTRFMGNRCNVEKPTRDEYGRIIDSQCWDTNPSSWHIAITNQMGASRRSLVMDSTFDYQVWNFPLGDYKYRYFNPQNWKETTNLNSAIVPVAKFKLDKFRKYRSPQAQYIVGVYMDVSHVNAINPTRGTLKETPLKTLRFIYDLELDANLNIIGGEWYSNAHPDFVWTFEKSAQAMAISDSDAQQTGWDTNLPVPAAWTQHAKRASKRGEPLYSFLKMLTTGASSPHEGDPNPASPEEVGPGGDGGFVLNEGR